MKGRKESHINPLKKIICEKREFLLIALIIILTLFSRIFLVKESGYLSDRNMYLSWASSSKDSAFGEIYKKSSSDNMPLILLMQREALKLHSHINFGLSALDFLKIPNIILDILSAIAIFYIVKRISPRHAFLSALIFSLNPAIIFVTSYWGQADTILFTLLAILFIEKPEISMIFLSASVFYKLQNIIFLPIILFFIIRKFSWKRVLSSLLAGAITAIAIIYPFASFGYLSDVTHVAFNSAGVYPHITMNAYNIWKIVDCTLGKCADEWWNSTSDNLMIFPHFSLRHFSLLLFFSSIVFSLAYIGIKTKKEKKRLFLEKDEKISKREICALILSCAFAAFSFFMLSTEMHERYLFYAMPLLAAAFFLFRELKAAYIIASASFLINCIRALTAIYKNNSFEIL
ncbi:MAG: hypothetical protein NTV63_05100, partial [Candidatus Woesearchaeota archaeon]|nr:hypothetical protein [Candidatus Woesearchaeota archaeon]